MNPDTEPGRAGMEVDFVWVRGQNGSGGGAGKGLDRAGDGGKIRETTSKTQFDAMNNRSNGKSR
jgi:hypothetical protein